MAGRATRLRETTFPRYITTVSTVVPPSGKNQIAVPGVQQWLPGPGSSKISSRSRIGSASTSRPLRGRDGSCATAGCAAEVDPTIIKLATSAILRMPDSVGPTQDLRHSVSREMTNRDVLDLLSSARPDDVAA